MHYLTVLLGSLLSMLGIQESPGQTSVTRISGDEQLLSRTTIKQGVARFQCLQSDSGRCIYLVYRENCRGTPDKALCEREPLADFVLSVGRSHDMRNLPSGFGQQVLLRR